MKTLYLGVGIGISVGVLAIVMVASAIYFTPDKFENTIDEKSEPEIQADLSKSKVLPLPATAQEIDDKIEFQGNTQVGEPMETPANHWIIVALVTLAIALLISISISFYLYRWRKILLSEPHMLVPEELGSWLSKLSHHVNGLTRTITSSAESVEGQSRATHQGVAELSETFMTMQQALDEREREIQRLKRGYDSEIFRKFVSRFIRVDQAVEDFQRSGSANEIGLEQIRRLLEDAFAECNVECFRPEISDDYRKAFGVADNPKSVKSNQPEEDFKIAEVLESGYLIRSGKNREIIVPAKVRIFRFQNGGDA